MILLGVPPIDTEDECGERYKWNQLREMEDIPNQVDSRVSNIEWSRVSKAAIAYLLTYLYVGRKCLRPKIWSGHPAYLDWNSVLFHRSNSGSTYVRQCGTPVLC